MIKNWEIERKFLQEQTKVNQNKIILNHLISEKNYKTTTKKGGAKDYIENRGDKLLFIYRSLNLFNLNECIICISYKRIRLSRVPSSHYSPLWSADNLQQQNIQSALTPLGVVILG